MEQLKGGVEISKICDWLMEQPEYTNYSVTYENSIFYHVSRAQYAELIERYCNELLKQIAELQAEKEQLMSDYMAI